MLRQYTKRLFLIAEKVSRLNKPESKAVAIVAAMCLLLVAWMCLLINLKLVCHIGLNNNIVLEEGKL